jgi:Flp pilus assembly CpaE family ATPase
MTAINNGKVIAEISPDSDIAKVYNKLAESETGLAVERPGGIFSWFK